MTPEITLTAINISMFLILAGFCWQLRSARNQTYSEVSSLRVLLRQLERQISNLPQTVDAENKPKHDNYDEHFSALAKGLKAHHQETEQALTRSSHNHSRLESMLGGIRDYLAEKNKLTERLQEGYDFQIIKNFARQIIRCVQQVEESQTNKTSTDSHALRTDLLDLLHRNGIERFSPSTGTPFSTLRKVAEVLPQKVETDNAELSGKVAQVISPGYRYTFNDNQHRIIMPAQVRIYGTRNK